MNGLDRILSFFRVMETNTLRECLLCHAEVVKKGLKEHLAQVHGVNLEDAQQFILQVFTITVFLSTFGNVQHKALYGKENVQVLE